MLRLVLMGTIRGDKLGMNLHLTEVGEMCFGLPVAI